jgi:hypothetical protein
MSFFGLIINPNSRFSHQTINIPQNSVLQLTTASLDTTNSNSNINNKDYTTILKYNHTFVGSKHMMPEQHHMQVRIKTRGSLHEGGIILNTLSCNTFNTNNSLNIELIHEDSPVEIWSISATHVPLDVHITGRWSKTSSITNELSSSSATTPIDCVSVTHLLSDDVMNIGGDNKAPVVNADIDMLFGSSINVVQTDNDVVHSTATATRKRTMMTNGDDESHKSKVKCSNNHDDDGLITEGYSTTNILPPKGDMTGGVIEESSSNGVMIMMEPVVDIGATVVDIGATVVTGRKSKKKSGRKSKASTSSLTDDDDDDDTQHPSLPNDINTKKLWKVTVENNEGKHSAHPFLL